MIEVGTGFVETHTDVYLLRTVESEETVTVLFVIFFIHSRNVVTDDSLPISSRRFRGR